ncbi:MAG TPA: transcriptional regulator [Lachnospiraceae bacterium]|nr:transcriptional regulator [Lachnospiraceae bacterium]
MENRELLKQIRSETGMSQKRFAAYFKIPIRTYEDWERGVRKMPKYLLCLMAYKLQVEGMIEHIPIQLADETNDE